jgi:glucose-1-phosphate cytidylyltransferase
MRKLTHEKQLVAFRHEGFWTCMDTFKDVERLNALWFKGEMPHTGYKGKPPWV